MHKTHSTPKKGDLKPAPSSESFLIMHTVKNVLIAGRTYLYGLFAPFFAVISGSITDAVYRYTLIFSIQAKPVTKRKISGKLKCGISVREARSQE